MKTANRILFEITENANITKGRLNGVKMSVLETERKQWSTKDNYNI